MTKCDNHVECTQMSRHLGCEWCSNCGVYVIEKSSTSTIPTAELEALRAKAEADSAELAKAEAEQEVKVLGAEADLAHTYLRNALAQRDAALAKLAAIEKLVGIGHGKDCYLWRTGRGRCTCKLGDIRAILQGTPEGQNV